MNINTLIKSNFFLFFVALIIPSLITGPFLPNLILGTSAFFFLIFVFKNKLWFVFNNNFFYFFFSFCFVCILSSLLSDNIIFSLKTSLFYFRVGIFAALISFLISNNKKFNNFFFLSLCISFVVLLVDGFYQYFNNYNLLGYVVEGWNRTRLSSLFGKELILGSYLSRLLPIFIALLLINKKNNKLQKFYWLIFCLVSILIYLSGERASFFFLLLNLCILLILVKFKKKFLIFSFIFIIISIFSYSNDKLFYRMSKSVLINDLKVITEDNKINLKNSEPIIFFSEGHDNLIRTAYNMFKDKPLLGVGPNMFRKKCSEENYAYNKSKHFCDTHPHNFYVQILAETGIFGFAILVLFFLNICREILIRFRNLYFKNKKVNNYETSVLISLFIASFPFITNGNFFNSWLVTIYSICIGFYIQFAYKNKK
jgi:O-antigen ligase